MLEFIEELVVTGIDERISKQGNKYTIVNYLGENGQTFGTVAECNIPNIKQLDKVNATLKVYPGRYLQLKTIGLELVS